MEHDRVLSVKSGENFRELGGYLTNNGKTTKWHKLLRSGNLSSLSPVDLKFLENYGVRYDVDLRSEPERTMAQDQITEDKIKYVFDPVFHEDDTENSKSPEEFSKTLESDPDYGEKHMEKVYRSMIINQDARDAFHKLFMVLLENNQNGQSTLFHCTAGKDRTGMSATFVLSALGVPLDVIKTDYLLTNKVAKPVIEKRLAQAKEEGLSDAAIKNLRALYSVSPKFFDAAMDEIKKNYGNMDNFLHEGLKLTDENIAQLQKLYLE